MIKILANDGIHPDGKLLLEEAGYQVDTEKVPQENLPTVLPDYDVVIVRSATKIREELIRKCPKLKMIARAGVGLDNIDVEVAESQSIKVINTPASSSQAVAELTFAHVFTLARHLHLANREMPERGATDFKALKKRYSKGVELSGKTMGIIGFGRIGQETARIALALGMRVLAADLKVEEASIGIHLLGYDNVDVSVRVSTVSLEELLQNADFISLHAPFTGVPLLGAEQFAQMKQGAVLINCSRGGTVDEASMLHALENGTLSAAGIDVFENEPTPRTEILEHERISLSPHIGASTVEAQRKIGLELADKILAFFGDDQ